MKPVLENITSKRGLQAFMAFAVNQPKFDFYWHYHPEYELTLIINGKGRRLIGDSHENFESGDLVLIGPGLPHTWVSGRGSKGKAEAVVIQFSGEFIERFADLEELTAINKLLLRAKQGIVFKGKIPPGSIQQIQLLPEKTGVEKITGLLHILHELSALKSVALASSYYQPLRGKENENRINKVCQYVQKYAAEPVTIHKAAALIHLSPGAFCKFFKRITGKTFSDYVNDIRIANVCSQLMATDKQVAEIAYGNGFESLTYFNRVFLKKKNMQPGSYRKLNRL
jgi:AraC-like DNA-binding protein